MNTDHLAPAGEDTDGGKRLTRKEVAQLRGVHVDTVRRWEDKYDLDTTHKHHTTGEVMLSAAELVAHGLLDPAQASLPEQSILRSRTERELTDARRQLAQLEAINDRLADEVAFLRSIVGPKTGRAA